MDYCAQGDRTRIWKLTTEKNRTAQFVAEIAEINFNRRFLEINKFLEKNKPEEFWRLYASILLEKRNYFDPLRTGFPGFFFVKNLVKK